MNAIETAEQFLQNWQEEKFASMEPVLQRTWIANNDGWFRWFEKIYGDRKLKKFKVLKEIRVGDLCKDVHAIVTVNGAKTRINIRVICELEAYKPDAKGTWGVNPISVLRGI